MPLARMNGPSPRSVLITKAVPATVSRPPGRPEQQVDADNCRAVGSRPVGPEDEAVDGGNQDRRRDQVTDGVKHWRAGRPCTMVGVPPRRTAMVPPLAASAVAGPAIAPEKVYRSGNWRYGGDARLDAPRRTQFQA